MPDLVLAADTGGTFTDVVLAGPDGLQTAKHLSTPEDPTDAVMAGVADVIAAAGASPSAIGRVVHGTTLATNVVLQRRGVDVAFVTTAGFRWMLELGRAAPVDEQRYDLRYAPAPPPVRLSHTHEVRERIAADGSVLVPLDEDDAARVAHLVAGQEVAAVAVCLLHSYAAPEHEHRLAEILAARLGPEIPIALSSEVLPEVREYDRACTTLMSAYVAPVMAGYLRRLADRLEQLGVRAPLQVMDCSGGVLQAAVAAAQPVRTIESGPAAAVTAATQIGATHGTPDVITFDMGGTTAKTGVVRGGRPDLTHELRVGGAASAAGRRGSGLPVKVPAIDLAEVGAGGGSIAWLDQVGGLHVGPVSAGAVPGPACYGNGGTAPTVTDANLVLGYLDADSLAGGGLVLDERAALAAVRTVADPLGLDVAEAAGAMHEIVNATMASAVHVVTVQRGIDPAGFALVALGGAAPAHAAAVAEKFGITTVLVPPHAGVGSAVGLVTAELTTERAATLRTTPTDADVATVDRLIGELEQAARLELGDHADTVVERQVDARYVGQGHELTVPLATGRPTAAALAAAAEAFEDRYRAEFGIDGGGAIELVTFRVRARVPGHAAPVSPRRQERGDDPPARRRSAWFAGVGGAVDTPVVAADSLADVADVAGPLLVESSASTLVVPPGWRARAMATGTLRLTTDRRATS